jgi:uncharacterized membrane protein YedE/YeeE
VNRPALTAASIAVVALSVYLSLSFNVAQSSLFLVGVGAGIVLYHASFGFTSSWRALIADGRGAGVRAQMLMLAVTSLVFFPILASGEWFGHPVRGSVSPIGLSVVVGAFIFGVGMQLGGGCASGTLYSAGGGSVRMLVTLAAFVGGSVIGVRHQPLWAGVPALEPVSLVATFGAIPALGISLPLFAAIALATRTIEERRHGSIEVLRSGGTWLRGPWPLVAGALGLAAVNVATLAIAGRPWGVTSALALWGSKMAASLGVDVASWPYWQGAARTAELQAPVLNDVTTVMNIGIMLGAFGAAALAGRLNPTLRVPARSLAAAVVGGLMLGYGARIAYGCNIGAYFSGIASSSLHGWLWLVAAFVGNTLGTRLRPAFGLRV